MFSNAQPRYRHILIVPMNDESSGHLACKQSASRVRLLIIVKPSPTECLWFHRTHRIKLEGTVETRSFNRLISLCPGLQTSQWQLWRWLPVDVRCKLSLQMRLLGCPTCPSVHFHCWRANHGLLELAECSRRCIRIFKTYPGLEFRLPTYMTDFGCDDSLELSSDCLEIFFCADFTAESIFLSKVGGKINNTATSKVLCWDHESSLWGQTQRSSFNIPLHLHNLHHSCDIYTRKYLKFQLQLSEA